MKPIVIYNLRQEKISQFYEMFPVLLSVFFLVLFGLNFRLKLFWKYKRRLNVVLAIFMAFCSAYFIWNLVDPFSESVGLNKQCSVYDPHVFEYNTKIKIITSFDKEQEFGTAMSKANEDYAMHWSFVFERHRDCYPLRRAVQWTKIALLYEECQKEGDGIEWLIWIDSDALFTNYRTDLSVVLKELDERVILAIGGDIGSRGRILNTGWMAWRKGDMAKALLEKIWVTGAKLRKRWLFAHEQESLTYLYNHDPETKKQVEILKDHIKLYSADTVRKPYMWEEGDFVAHAAGWEPQSKTKALRQIRSKIRK